MNAETKVSLTQKIEYIQDMLEGLNHHFGDIPHEVSLRSQEASGSVYKAQIALEGKKVDG